MNKQEFVDFMLDLLEKFDLCDSMAQRALIEPKLEDVFNNFDADLSGKLDAEEIANCLAMMCGGTINEKIFAAFKLFDLNDSTTLSFDELNKFLNCVFQIFYSIRDNSSEIWDKVEMKKMSYTTAEKCFSDNKIVQGKGEVNFTQFMQWMTG